jgi:MoxR-like ATPase
MGLMQRKEAAPAGVASALERLIARLGEVVVLPRATLGMALMPLLCRGHLLIEDVPGVGKTLLAKALARCLRAQSSRIQFTPDLLPLDVTGVSTFDPATQGFRFHPGPVFTNVLLADEINRATPRTQSALLECMEERQVTVDGHVRRLPEPFFVIATQNPVEHAGTFPLPEAQLDRFLIRMSLGYPSTQSALRILREQRTHEPLDGLEPVLDLDEVRAIQRQVEQVECSEPVLRYVVDLVEATRVDPAVRLGASPRASLALMRCAQAQALLQGRAYVTPHHVKLSAGAVLAHRLILDSSAVLKGRSVGEVLDGIIRRVAAPSG